MSESDLASVLAGTARWAVLEGDSLAVLRALPDASVDAVLTDPPYDARTHAGARSGVDKRHDIPFAALSSMDWLVEALRVSRGWVVAFCSLEMLGAYADAAGPSWIRAGVWHKPDAPPQFTGDRPAQGAEGVAIMHRKGRKTWNGGGHHAFWSCGLERNDRVHPTQKPVRLMRDLVSLFAPEGGVVLDPYGGSGTTGVAALAEGRRAIVCEREAEYATLARGRCEATTRGVPYRASPQQGALFSLASAKPSSPESSE